MSEVSSAITASKIQMDYMTLLITQLQNQNPLEPLSTSEMASQLAQMASLQQLESMSTSFASVLDAVELEYANSLLGKEITFLLMDSLTGDVIKERRMVGEIYNDTDGEKYLVVDRHDLGLGDVVDSLIGESISYFSEGGDGGTYLVKGIVNSVDRDALGESFFIIDGKKVYFKDVSTESLIGRNVSFDIIDESTGYVETRTSTINEISKGADGRSLLEVGRYVRLKDVVSIINPQ